MQRGSFALLVAFALLASCRDEAPARRTSEAVTFHGDVVGRAADEVVIDIHPSGDALVGRVLEAPENSDAMREVDIRRVGRSSFAARALDAKIVSDTAVLVLLTDRTLRLRDAAGERVVDRGVYGPLALSEDRAKALYTRGQMPELEVVRADLATGATERVAPGMVPAWCPAWAGDDVVFVASPEGSPSLYRQHGAQPPRAMPLARGEPFPTGPAAPIVVGSTLIFEDERGLHTRSLVDASRSDVAGVRLPVAWTASQVVLVHRGDGPGTELLPLVLGGGAR